MPAPLVVGAIAGLAAAIVPLAVKLLAALGIGFVTYSGITLLLDGVATQIQAQFAIPGFEYVTNLLAYMNVDRAISLMLSAITVRATLRGLQAGGDLRRLTT